MNSNWVVVTGATGGIGQACAEELAGRGFSVVLSSSSATRLAEQFADDDPRRLLIPCDLSDPSAIRKFVDDVSYRVGCIAGFVHAAGIQRITPLGMFRAEQVSQMFAVNTFSAMELVSLFAKRGRTEPEGASFVLVSSLAAHEGASGNSVYAASKAALEGFVPPAASELVSKNVRLNVIVPGYVVTPMTDAFFRLAPPERREAVRQSYPLGLGEPRQIAKLVSFLISGESSWITGQRFIIDGGHSIRP
jgi:NAD(P)-dependent dehydrogenase (short-subunit alcohol dehydrogenase family)